MFNIALLARKKLQREKNTEQQPSSFSKKLTAKTNNKQ